MAVTRNEFIEDLSERIKKAVPENVELDAETMESIESAIEDEVENANLESEDDEEE